jgi:hypothetical protein
VVNWPPSLREKIIKNSRNFQEEREAKDRRALLEYYTERSQRGAVFISPPLEVEIFSALRYLRENDIPCQFVPEEIRIRISSNSPLPPPGVLFESIVSQVFSDVFLNLKSDSLEESLNSDEDEEQKIFVQDSLFDEERILGEERWKPRKVLIEKIQ